MPSNINIYDPHVLGQIKLIGYPSMLLLMTLEGPVATVLSAFSASLGFFNIFIVFSLSIFGDILGDFIFYSLGYFGGNNLLVKAQKILRITPIMMEKIERLFSRHGKRTIVAVKSTTGLCWITFIAAGAFKMNFREFLSGAFLGGIIWSGFLVIIGYFFGYAFIKIGNYIKYAGIIIFISLVIFYLAVTFFKKYQSKKILESNGKERN